MTTIHTMAYASPDGDMWGVHWLPAEVGSAPLACRVDGATDRLLAELKKADGDGPWRLEGAGVSLVFMPSGPAGRGGSPAAGVESVERLCSVAGTVVLDGREREIDCPGWRAEARCDFELAAIDTFRQTYGWFDVADGLSLLALRPRKSRGHDTDLVAATVLEAESVPHVADPRLSSTYNAAGTPSRVGLELWFDSDGSDEEAAEDNDRQFPRRAAGEAIGDEIQWEIAGFTLRAVPLRWHSRGNDGGGLYVLGQRGGER